MKTTFVTVIDQNLEDALLLIAVLQDIGITRVIHFRSCEEALETFLQNRTNYSRAIIFLKADQEKDAVSCVESLMNDEDLSGAQVILTQSKSVPFDPLWIMKAGAIGYLKYPLDRKKLTSLLKQISLRRYRVS